VWHTAIAGLAVGVFAFWVENVSYLYAFTRGDFGRASAALDQLGWVGKESSTARLAVAMQLLRRGDLAGARQQVARSIALRETTDGYVLTGMIEETAQDTREALAAYQRALAIDPNRRDALIRAGTLQQALGENAQARVLLDRAAALESASQNPGRGPNPY
jgi:Tfp pilus assembly protein PilF